MWKDLLQGLLKKKNNGGNKKFNFSIGAILLLGIILLAFGSFGMNGKKVSAPSAPSSQTKNSAVVFGRGSVQKDLESQLKSILERVQGAGSVDVEVNLDTSKQYVYAQNSVAEDSEIQETDNAGGTRVTKTKKISSDLVVVNKGNGEGPILLKEVQPQIRGVLVVAEGAKDSTVKAELTLAVETALGLPAHKVLVLPKE